MLIPGSIALVCAAVGLVVSCWILRWDAPYENRAYREFATANPDLGFEEYAGYTGSQIFFWNEILTSREFGLSVLHEADPATRRQWWGTPPRVWASRQIIFDDKPDSKPSLYLGIYQGAGAHQYAPAENFRKDLSEEFIPVEKAFVKAARARGVEVTPVGDIIPWTKDHGTWKAELEYLWLPFTALALGTAFAVSFFLDRPRRETDAKPENSPGV